MASASCPNLSVVNRPQLEDIFSGTAMTLMFVAVLASSVVVTYAAIHIRNVFVACHEPRCINLTTDLLLTMDEKADPCEDFYHFACGNYESAYPTSASYMDAFAKRVKRSFREMIRDFAVDKTPSVEQYPLLAYRTCMMEYHEEKEYLATLRRNDDEVADLWKKRSHKKTTGAKISFLISLSLERGTPVFVGTGVARNSFTHQHNLLRLKIERPKEPLQRRTVQNIIEYLSRVSDWITAFEVSKAIVNTTRGALDAVKASLDETMPQLVEARHIDELLVGMPASLFVKTVRSASIQHFSLHSQVFTTDSLALRYLSTYLDKLGEDAFSYTVRFAVAESLMMTSTYAIADLYEISAAAAFRYRMIRCADLSLILLSSLSEYQFFRQWLLQGGSTAPPKLFPSLLDKYALVEPYSKMAPETKAQLQNALSATSIIRGRDPGYSTIREIHEKFSALTFDASNFTGWALHALRVRAELQAKALTTHNMLPANAYSLNLDSRVDYDATEDAVRVLPSLLLPPFSVDPKPSAFTFGHLGTYVAEALARALLPESLSGVTSKLSYPMADQDVYMKSLDCLLHDHMRAEKVLLSVKETLDLLVSLVGARVAYKTWEEWKFAGSSSSSTPVVPHVRSDEQKFFVGYCLRFCGISETAAHRKNDDRYSVVNVSQSDRCNLPLRHMPEFAAAFRCSANKSAMVASDKCA